MSLLFVLALLASDPQASAPADAAPVATQGQEDPDYLPKGAPSDDYAFVAWCDGVLSGHMDLAAHLSDVLPLDDVQQTIGHDYLRAYAQAMATSPESKTAEGRKRAEAARLDGWSRWEAARNTPDKNLAVNTYLAYQLPGRCEHAAERLSHNPKLFARAPSVDEVAAMGTNAVSTRADAMASHAPPPAAHPVAMSMPMTAAVTPSPAPAAAQTGQISVQMTEESQPVATVPAAAQATPPPPAPAPVAAPVAAPVKTAVVDRRPKRGHFLPPIFRSKASKEKEAQEDAAAAAGSPQ
ncbi:MAG TPA: hypothetical protein VG407_15240 [Caulobacteraceae bacterium]|jgi:hypothetical protein|nr:hypothetical protein [Caulobacteraceae bacterium]